MKKNEDYLENALVAVGAKKLPAAIGNDVAYDGMAIIKIRKVGGKEYYGVGTWNSTLKRSNIARDFDTKPEESVTETYPVGKAAKVETAEDMETRIRKEMEVKFELRGLGIEVPEDASPAELRVLLTEKQAELSGDDLDAAKELLSGFGYSDIYLNKITLTEANVSLDKVKNIQTEITKLGEIPAATKKEMEAQLKELKKK